MASRVEFRQSSVDYQPSDEDTSVREVSRVVGGHVFERTSVYFEIPS